MDRCEMLALNSLTNEHQEQSKKNEVEISLEHSMRIQMQVDNTIMSASIESEIKGTKTQLSRGF